MIRRVSSEYISFVGKLSRSSFKQPAGTFGLTAMITCCWKKRSKQLSLVESEGLYGDV